MESFVRGQEWIDDAGVENEAFVFTRLDLYARVENGLKQRYKSSRNTAALHIRLQALHSRLQWGTRVERFTPFWNASGGRLCSLRQTKAWRTIDFASRSNEAYVKFEVGSAIVNDMKRNTAVLVRSTRMASSSGVRGFIRGILAQSAK